eukprot:m.29654 g.29654  ORF g.29654 m.29654 type:complete len:87 (-) comp12131_c0_seq1:122-382(-)
MYGLPWSLHSFLNICVRWLQFVTYRVSDAKSRVVDSEATLKELRGKQGALRHQLAEIQALQKSVCASQSRVGSAVSVIFRSCGVDI